MRTKKMILISILVYISALVFVGLTLAGWEEDYERSTRAAEGVSIQTEMIKKNQKALVDKDNLLFQRITDLFVRRDATGAVIGIEGVISEGNPDAITLVPKASDLPPEQPEQPEQPAPPESDTSGELGLSGVEEGKSEPGGAGASTSIPPEEPKSESEPKDDKK